MNINPNEMKTEELQSIKYIKKIRELLRLGDSININARLIHLELMINEDLEQYAQQRLDEFAKYIEDNYEEGDGDTITIYDWLYDFNEKMS